MPLTARDIEQRLRERLSPQTLQVIDESALHAGHAGASAEGFGTHFRVRLWAPAFAGRPRVARHRLVYDALHDFPAAGLHALAIEILDPSPQEDSP